MRGELTRANQPATLKLTGLCSLCPLNSSVPIEAAGIIPIAVSDVADFPSIAFTIPDFEGEAILRIFANSTESEIGCYSAVVTNGNSFSHPAAVGTVLGFFTFVALLASFATAIYGEAVPTMRLHYAHSLSVGVVFAVFQHIFFTGALSVNWPSVLPAWWSNFAWAGGMIYSSSMQNSINKLIGNNVGNTTEVGAAASGTTQDNLGGGYDISQIYKRAMRLGPKQYGRHPLVRDIASEIYGRPSGNIMPRDLARRELTQTIARRALANSTTGYKWYGHAVGQGLPLPGNYSGFAGTLAQEGIRTSNAFMTGFLWFLILLALLVGALVAFKWCLELLSIVKIVKHDRLRFFREHWVGYSAVLALRTCYLGFFAIMFLTIFQFTYNSSSGVKAIAGIVFAIFLVGMSAIVAYAVLYKMHIDTRDGRARKYQVEQNKLLGIIPWFKIKRMSATDHEHGDHQDIPGSKSSSTPFWRRMPSTMSLIDQSNINNIHDNEEYTMKFGWLAARFRRTRWWFFTVFIVYELLQAIFYGGASGYPLAQVFGLLVVEFLALVYIVWARPFEGQRLNILVVYCLGFSKVASVALSAAFDTQFNLPRIITTVIGIVMIVIQGILTIITMVAIVIGAISSYMSVSRNSEDFRPRAWVGLREKYFDHLDKTVNDLPPEPKPERPPSPKEKKEGFEMMGMRRLAKIEDEDEEFASEMRPHDPTASYKGLDAPHAPNPSRRASMMDGASTPVGRSRAASVNSINQTNLPFGARSHRPSWSARDFNDYSDRGFTQVDMNKYVPDEPRVATPPPASDSGRHSRTPSRSATLPNPKVRAQVSNDSLRIGGDVSTRDTIGKVPAPSVRARAGTHGSFRGSRTNAPMFGENMEGFSETTDMLPGSQRGSRAPMLTPAQEQEEFSLSPRPSRGQ